MKGVIFAEAFRLRRALLLLLALAAAQLAAIAFFEPDEYAERGHRAFTPAQYRELIRDLSSGVLEEDDVYLRRDGLDAYFDVYWQDLPDSAVIPVPVLRYTDSAYAENALYRRVASDMDKTALYQDYLAEIQDAANRLTASSVFNKQNGYTARAVQKTAAQYASLISLAPEWSDPSGARVAITPGGIGWVGLLGLLVFVMPLTNGTRPARTLIRSTRLGRRPLLAARLVCMTAYTVCLATALTLSGIVYGSIYYGLGDLSRPLQTVFQESPWALSVGRAILISWGLRCVTFLSLALPLTALFHILPNMIACFCVTAAATGAGMVGYSAIPVYSWLNLLKWVNPFGFLNAGMMVTQYRCVNLFGQPVILPLVMCVAGPVFALFCSGLLLADKSFIHIPLNWHIKHGEKPKRYSDKIITHEVWRLLWVYKVIIVLLCLGAVTFLRCYWFVPHTYPMEAEYRKAVETAAALPEDQRHIWVKDALISASGWRADALRQVDARLRYLAANPGGELIYDTGWRYLLGLTDQSRADYAVGILLLLIGAAFCVTPAREQDAALLLRTARHGRGLLTRRKLLVAELSGTAAAMLAFTPALWHSLRLYGLPEGPARSLPELPGIGLPLWMLGCSVFLGGVLLSLLIGAGVYAVSRFGIRASLGICAAVSVLWVLIAIV